MQDDSLICFNFALAHLSFEPLNVSHFILNSSLTFFANKESSKKVLRTLHVLDFLVSTEGQIQKRFSFKQNVYSLILLAYVYVGGYVREY